MCLHRHIVKLNAVGTTRLMEAFGYGEVTHVSYILELQLELDIHFCGIGFGYLAPTVPPVLDFTWHFLVGL